MEVVCSGEDGLLLFAKEKPDIVLLDVILPNMDGFSVISEIRVKNSHVLIIMMTCIEFSKENQIRGYQLGTINYMKKPFIPYAILSLIQNLLLIPSDVKIFSIDTNAITIQGQFVTIGDLNYDVREKDSKVLLFLLERIGQIVNRSIILNHIWYDDHPDKNNLFDSSILRLRKLVKDIPGMKIKSIYGFGYMITIENVT